jgi:hypothetical protein
MNSLCFKLVHLFAEDRKVMIFFNVLHLGPSRCITNAHIFLSSD